MLAKAVLVLLYLQLSAKLTKGLVWPVLPKRLGNVISMQRFSLLLDNWVIHQSPNQWNQPIRPSTSNRLWARVVRCSDSGKSHINQYWKQCCFHPGAVKTCLHLRRRTLPPIRQKRQQHYCWRTRRIVITIGMADYLKVTKLKGQSNYKEWEMTVRNTLILRNNLRWWRLNIRHHRIQASLYLKAMIHQNHRHLRHLSPPSFGLNWNRNTRNMLNRMMRLWLEYKLLWPMIFDHKWKASKRLRNAGPSWKNYMELNHMRLRKPRSSLFKSFELIRSRIFTAA